MKRVVCTPRPDWQQRVESVGFTYHSGGKPPVEGEGTFWDEGTAYEFTAAEIDTIEAATEELHRLCIAAVDHVVAHPELMDRFAIPAAFRPYIVKSWARRDPHVLGRMDLAFDPATGAVKMLEYNADTPTLMIETGVVQWFWMEEVKPGTDQFNSLHERLINRYREIGNLMPIDTVLHVSTLRAAQERWDDRIVCSREEYQHGLYIADLAEQAGIPVKLCPIGDIGEIPNVGLFDQDDQPIRFWSKLYPWEWLAAEPLGHHLPEDRIGCLEPVWKMLMSNKAILAVLWQLFPGHPNLLPCFFEEDRAKLGGAYVVKPILSREGANIRMVTPGQPETVTAGPYARHAAIYQEKVELPSFDGNRIVIGSWVVGDAAAGMILREAASEIVVSDSKVVPHYFI